MAFKTKTTRICMLLSVLTLAVICMPAAEASLISKKDVAVAGVGLGTALYMKSTLHIARDLSFHPDKAEPFFSEHPDRFGPVFRYVQRALAQPANQKDYDRYFKLSEIMGRLNIPGFQQAPESGPNVYDNPMHIPKKDEHLITTPITPTRAGSNIIYTPQGKPIDTTEEYPMEPIRNWQDYILLKSHSQRLSDEMVANGVIREKDTAAHHIIPATHPLAARARAILEQYSNVLGTDAFNNAINGVFLPTASTSKQTGIIHNGKHPNNYVSRVDQLIVDADARGGINAVVSTLTYIRSILQNPPPNSTWSNIL